MHAEIDFGTPVAIDWVKKAEARLFHPNTQNPFTEFTLKERRHEIKDYKISRDQKTCPYS